MWETHVESLETDDWSFSGEVCIIYDRWCISQCIEIIFKQNKRQKQVYLVCVAKPIKREQWMNEWTNIISTSVHLWVSFSLEISYNLQCEQQQYWRNKKTGNVKKWKRKQSYTEMKLMWQWMGILKTCRLLYYRYIMAWHLHAAVCFAFSIFRLAFVLVIAVAITIVIVAAATGAAPVVLVFVAVMFPIDCFFSIWLFPSIVFSHSFGYTSVAWNEVWCCRFFQTILPVNYLIKWNGCFKY